MLGSMSGGQPWVRQIWFLHPGTDLLSGVCSLVHPSIHLFVRSFIQQTLLRGRSRACGALWATGRTQAFTLKKVGTMKGSRQDVP